MAVLILSTGCGKSPTKPTQQASTNSSTIQTQNDPKQAAGAEVSNEPIIKFEDVSRKVGLNHVYHNGEESDLYTYLEAMGGGLGVLDFDLDGLSDLFLPSGGKLPKLGTISPLPGQLLRNRSGKRFEDVTPSAQLNESRFYSQGVAVGDINSDGFPDLLVTGFGGVDLFLNLGDGTFRQSADELGVVDPSWSTSAAFADLDNNGFVDIYITHYVDWTWEKNPQCISTARVRDICPPASFDGLPDCVFANQGNGTFKKLDQEIGLLPGGKGLGVVCSDLDQDGKVDIYVANDTNNNYLYLNRGNLKFEEIGVDSGAALDDHGVSNGSMGIAVLDYDGNLTPDLWVCNYEDETFALYKNDGGANYRFVSSSAGITALGTLFVAFGTVAADFDRDGDEDLVVANGHVLRFPSDTTVAQKPLLLTNTGKGKFLRQPTPEGDFFSQLYRGRGLVQLDFDLDGDLDLAFSNVNQPASILLNQTVATGQWCSLTLIGQASNRDAVGSQIIFTTEKSNKPKRYVRWVVGGGSYQSQSPYTVQWASPADEKLVQVEITWPNGGVQKLDGVPVNQRTVIVERLQLK